MGNIPAFYGTKPTDCGQSELASSAFQWVEYSSAGDISECFTFLPACILLVILVCVPCLQASVNVFPNVNHTHSIHYTCAGMLTSSETRTLNIMLVLECTTLLFQVVFECTPTAWRTAVASCRALCQHAGPTLREDPF